MSSDDKLYVVVMGDVSGSKKLSSHSRYQTQLFMKSAIVQINEEFAEDIDAPFMISKGDEFQGLVHSLDAGFRIVLALEKLTFPVKLRFGVGIGNIYRMGGSLPIEMDGPAFHRGNTALNLAKKKKLAYYLNSENPADMLINTSFQLISAIKKRWSERHHRLFWSYKDLGTYRRVAEEENITPQAVCDILKNTRALHVRDAEESLLAFFKQTPLQRFSSDLLTLEDAASLS